MAISNLTYKDYLWIKKEGNDIKGIRLSKNNLPTDIAYTSANLFNANNIEYGSIRENGANLESGTNRARSFYIPVLANTYYSISTNNSELLIYELYQYDSNKSHIEPYTSILNNTFTFLTRNNTYYIRILFRNTSNTDFNLDILSSVMLNEGSTPLPYQSYEDKVVYEKDLENYVTTDISQTISASKTFTANNSFIGESKFSNDSYCPENSIADIAYGIGKSSLFARSATMQTIAGQIMAPNSNGINDTYGYATEAGKIKLQYIASNSASQVNGSDIAVFSRDNIFFTSTNRPIWNNYMLALSNETGTGTIEVRQNGTSKGSFKLNDSTSQTIDFTDTTYSAGTGLSLNSNNNTFSVKTGYTTDANKRNYKVAADSSGNLYVNVPWSSSGTLDTSLSSTSTNALQNKAIYSAFSSAVGYDNDYYAYGATGSWRLRQYNTTGNSLDIKYGVITINSQNANYIVSFSGKDFTSTNYTIVFGLYRSNTQSWFWSPIVQNKTVSGFTVFLRGNGSGDSGGTIMYLAIRSN